MKTDKNIGRLFLLLFLLSVLLTTALFSQRVPTGEQQNIETEQGIQQYESPITQPTTQNPLYTGADPPANVVYRRQPVANFDIYGTPNTANWGNFGLVGLIIGVLLGFVGIVLRFNMANQKEMLKAITNNTLAIQKLTDVIQGDIKQVAQKVDALTTNVNAVDNKVESLRLKLASSNSSSNKTK